MLEHYNEIIPNLYLGDAGFIYEPELPEFGLIINCCPEINIKYKTQTPESTVRETQFPDRAFMLIRLKFNDDPADSDKLLEILKQTQVLETMHESLVSNKKVMVHCAMGVQRSATIVAFYLLKYTAIDVNKIIRYIQYKRPQAFTDNNVTFMKALQTFH